MKESSPLISVITVTYNSGEFIHEAITSALNADYTNLELIIADDMSTDDTWKIIQQFNDPRINAVRNKKNLGEYENRNRCIAKAKGKYFLFVDGDDYLLNQGLAETIDQMERYPTCALGIVRPKSENLVSPVLLSPKESFFKHYFQESPLNLSFARNIFKTETVQELGGLPTNIYSGDDYIRLRLAAEYDCLLLVKPFAQWRQRPGQATERKGKTFKGIIEPYQINAYFLFQDYCPLTDTDQKRATTKIVKKMLFHSLLLMRHGNFRYGLNLLREAKHVFLGAKDHSLQLKFSTSCNTVK